MSDNQLRKLESTEVTPMIKSLVEMQSRFNSSTFHLDAFSQAAYVAEQLDVLMVALDNLRQALRQSEARQKPAKLDPPAAMIDRPDGSRLREFERKHGSGRVSPKPMGDSEPITPDYDNRPMSKRL